MPMISIPFTEEKFDKLCSLAGKLGQPVEEYLRIKVDELLAKGDVDFQTAAAYVVKKNEELYRRLAK